MATAHPVCGSGDAVIAARAITVTFGRTIALDRVDFELEPGIVGLFGPNGSGKSTLLRVLAGLLRPDRGHVDFDGTPLDPKREGVRRAIGYVGHNGGLYDALTVAENINVWADLHGIEPDARVETIDRLGLNDKAATRAGELSAGFRRRAAVARALVHDPDVLLLDEPYANLDDDAAEIVSSAIRWWWAEGKTAVIATHGAKKVRAYADAGLILRNGILAHQRGSFQDERA